jgi:hypothetical protein
MFSIFILSQQCIFKQGHLDVELNDAGRQQAAAVSYQLSLIYYMPWIAIKTQIMGYEPCRRLSLLPQSYNLMFFLLKVADRLSREPNISVVYSSDLKRAFETAQIIATSSGGLEV